MLASNVWKLPKEQCLWLILISLLLANFFCWQQIRQQTSNEDFLFIPTHPAVWQAKIFSLGDDAFYFRISGLRLQNFADALGRLTSFLVYDFDKIKNWMLFLMNFDSKSHLVPSIAAYYYGGAPDNEKKLQVANYLEEYAVTDFEERWWWMTQAILLASQAKDHQYAARMAKNFEDYYFSSEKDIPTWVKYLPVIYTAKTGDKEKAYQMLQLIYENRTDLDKYDFNYMNHFLKNQLKELEIDEEFAHK